MEKQVAGNGNCINHAKIDATHLCLTCHSFLCMECAFVHIRSLSENQENNPCSENALNLTPKNTHSVQPLANIAANLTDNLQLAIHRYKEIINKNEQLKELSQLLTKLHIDKENYIETIKNMFENTIKEAEKIFMKKVTKIEQNFSESMQKITDEERTQRSKIALFNTLQKAYKAGKFYDIFCNKEIIEKYSKSTVNNICDLEKLAILAKNDIEEYKKSSEDLTIIELKLEETLSQWLYLIANKLNSQEEAQLKQKKLLAKARRHILWNEMKEKIDELTANYSQMQTELIQSQDELKKLKDFEKYIEDDTFSMLAEAMIGGTKGNNKAELVFKKLGPYVRSAKVSTKLIFNGVEHCPEGTYCGYWNKIVNKKEGKGVMLYNDGRIYEGFWKNDMPSGNGRMILPTGNVYEGQVYKGKFHGFGKYTWYNGEFYVGEMKSGMRDGYGMYITNEYAYIGQWTDDKFNGYGIKSWDIGEVYVGEFKNDIREGLGIYAWKDGKKYAGKYFANKETGEGVMLYENEIKNANKTNGLFKSELEEKLSRKTTKDTGGLEESKDDVFI